MQNTFVEQLTSEQVGYFEKLVGAELWCIYCQSGQVGIGKNTCFRGAGKLVFSAIKDDLNFKMRLDFNHQESRKFHVEFFEWQKEPSVHEGYNPSTTKFDYRFSHQEGNDFHIYFRLEQPNESVHFPLKNKIHSIRIYNYRLHFKSDEEETLFDYVAFIDIATEGGQRVVIERDDNVGHYSIYFDDTNLLNLRLAEIHDDPGETFGQKRYQLKHHFRNPINFP
jgi:hypothetical protein